eukprot:UN07604
MWNIALHIAFNTSCEPSFICYFSYTTIIKIKSYSDRKLTSCTLRKSIKISLLLKYIVHKINAPYDSI